ncbi:MAG: ABC transporter substrate-binding protein [bacterium]
MSRKRMIVLALVAAVVVVVAVVAYNRSAVGPAAGQGVTDDEILIGSHQALSGPVAIWGVPITNGMRMRADEINEAGGIHGRKINLIVEDHAYLQSRAAQAGDKLLQRDKVFALVGALGTPQNMVVMPRALKMGVPNLFPASAAVEMYEPFHKLKFAAVVPYYYSVRAAVSYFVKQEGKTKIAVMYQDDDFGLNTLRGVQDEAKELGLDLVAETSYKRGAKDFSSQIALMKSAGADLVVLGTIIAETIGAKVEARKIGWDVDMVVNVAGYAPEVAELARGASDGLYAIGYFPIPYRDSVSPEVGEWMDAYESRFGDMPSIQAVIGYVFMDLFYQGANNAGPNLTAESVAEGIEAIRDYKTIFGPGKFNFSATDHLGASIHEDILLCQVKGTRWETLRTISY